ncbi:response regulator [Hymenobacter sublimis]|uniref:Response regulator n=1 Tax=Hymenobacter sublimis TaxID=2933777 RepID=A0ABY4J849_9BACT|nr:response regulator [Hymenobacter sublimis]UPL47579.1 response regulator [Hymenobacter sublimis]
MLPFHVLLIEDACIFQYGLSWQLAAWGFQHVVVASTSQEAVRAAARQRPDLILVSASLKGTPGGLETVRLIQQQYASLIPVLVLQDHRPGGEPQMLPSQLLNYRCLPKPPTVEELQEGVELSIRDLALVTVS